MNYCDYIESLENRWIGRSVRFCGKFYKVVGVDYNGSLIIDKLAEYTDTTAISLDSVEGWIEKGMWAI